MYRKTVTFEDYNGVTRTEDHYFHLNEAEVMEMEMGIDGGLAEMIQRIVAAQSAPEIMKVFKEIVLKSYGQKSPDGRRFIKNEELRTEFSQTEAYSKIFMELATNTKEAIAFVNGIIPKKADTGVQQPPNITPVG